MLTTSTTAASHTAAAAAAAAAAATEAGRSVRQRPSARSVVTVTAGAIYMNYLGAPDL